MDINSKRKKIVLIRKKGKIKVRTLEQIRLGNQNDNLLFVGMEETPVKMSSEFRKHEKEVYDKFIKPISRQVFSRYTNKTR